MVLSRVPGRTWKIVVHIFALLPLLWLILDAILENFSINPYEEIIRRTGQAAILGVVFTLACSPLARWFSIPAILNLRKPLGLYAFFYALLHFLTFVILGYNTDLALVLNEILGRPFLIIGLIAFLFLLTLAITSNNTARKMLSKNWKTIHNLLYPAALLIGVHYLMARKIASSQSILAAVVIVALLLARIIPLQLQMNKSNSQKPDQV